MKVLITGATGFTGSYVVPLLLEQGMEVSCFVRNSSDISLLPHDKVRLERGDLSNVDSLRQALRGMDALVNVASARGVSITRSGPNSLISPSVTL